jgi:hypothetical protein
MFATILTRVTRQAFSEDGMETIGTKVHSFGRHVIGATRESSLRRGESKALTIPGTTLVAAWNALWCI